MISKEFLGWISLALTIISYAPYIASIVCGKTKPHIFTWVIWMLIMGIGYFGQQAGGAGPGAWATGMTALLNAIVIILSLTKGERNITRFDWMCFIAALSAIPLWKLTHDPLYAVVLVTFVELTGFGPTVRKTFLRSNEENMSPYLVGIPKHIFAIMALEAYNGTTLLLPVALTLANTAFVSTIFWRRRASKSPSFDAAAGGS